MNFDDSVRFRGRGLFTFEEYFAPLSNLVKSHLTKNERVINILEIGCGLASLLLELKNVFGERVHCVGINRYYKNGDFKAVNKNFKRLVQSNRIAAPALPDIVICDVSNGLPFANESFDFIISQFAWSYFGNKENLLSEIPALLKPDGQAFVHLFGDPAEDNHLIEVTTEDGGAVLTTDSLATCMGYKVNGSEFQRYLSYDKKDSLGNPRLNLLHLGDKYGQDKVFSLYVMAS